MRTSSATRRSCKNLPATGLSVSHFGKAKQPQMRKKLMKTKKISPQEMEKYIARFNDVPKLSSSYSDEMGIPKEAYETMTA